MINNLQTRMFYDTNKLIPSEMLVNPIFCRTVKLLVNYTLTNDLHDTFMLALMGAENSGQLDECYKLFVSIERNQAKRKQFHRFSAKLINDIFLLGQLELYNDTVTAQQRWIGENTILYPAQIEAIGTMAERVITFISRYEVIALDLLFEGTTPCTIDFITDKGVVDLYFSSKPADNPRLLKALTQTQIAKESVRYKRYDYPEITLFNPYLNVAYTTSFLQSIEKAS